MIRISEAETAAVDTTSTKATSTEATSTVATSAPAATSTIAAAAASADVYGDNHFFTGVIAVAAIRGDDEVQPRGGKGHGETGG